MGINNSREGERERNTVYTLCTLCPKRLLSHHVSDAAAAASSSHYAVSFYPENVLGYQEGRERERSNSSFRLMSEDERWS